MAASSVSNIAADIWFVKGFGMGVDGVAWATFMCQGVSCVLAVVFVFNRLRQIKGEEKSRAFDKKIFFKIFGIALPSTLQQSFVSVGNIVIQSVINSFGPAVIAGYSASVKLNNLVVTSFNTVGNGISNYTAQNVGAKRMNRVKQGFSAGIKMVWIICVPIVLLYVFAGKYLIYAFMDNPSDAALQSGFLFLRIVSPFYFLVSAKLVADAVLRGAGLMKQFVITTFTDLLLRVALAFILSGTPLKSTGIWCAWPIGWIVATAISLIFYKRNIADRKEAVDEID